MRPQCSVSDCGRDIRTIGLCNAHYLRQYKYGDPLGSKPQPSDADRFWAKVNKQGPIPSYAPHLGSCWIWKPSHTPREYGRFSGTMHRLVGAHRYAYELERGPIPPNLDLDHLCRVPACVNPAHLEAVTHQENNRRGDPENNRSRHMRERTHCPQGHPYNAANTYRDKHGHRICRTCRLEQARAHYRKIVTQH